MKPDLKPSLAGAMLLSLNLWACAPRALAMEEPIGSATGNAKPTARIAEFEGDRAAAISYTFDDNLRDQYTLAVPMLDEMNFKGTFFVIAGKTAETPEEGEQKQENGNPRNLWGGISWPELKNMADHGHEIASHTWTHPSLTKLTPEDLDAQLGKAYDAIKTRIGKPPLTIAFPGNASNPDVQAAALKYHVAYRGFQQSTKGNSTVASLNTWADKLIQEKKWGVLMIHGIAKGYAALSDPEIFHEHLKYVKGRERDVWIDTFANISRYEKERDGAKLKLAGDPGHITFELSSALNLQLDHVPLTIVIDAAGVTMASANRAGENLPVRVGKSSIQIEAVPSMQPIAVTWK